ncbi:MAG TPA: RHS repeat-associated core domain-containing protein, partial [Acidobacteriaceae bacterium]|nr:RHS repeat-associated core domain-containing protein [Acidobacteriaceae bacterium]
DRYTGLDRFGRNIDQNYINTSTGVSTDRFQYGYDPNSNVLYKSNLVSSANSELYHLNGSSNGYDNLNRLPAFSRGTLNSTHDTITAASRSQTWALDALGNWTSNSDSVSGTQTRSANAQDQLSAISGKIVDNSTTTAVLPTYDNNGNTTKDERGFTYTYDAWNRILTVKNASGVLIATYTYDALGNRISITENGVLTDLYYNGKQVIEERQSGTVVNQYVWSLGYVNNLLLRDDNSVTGSLGKSGSGLGVRVFAQHDAVYNTTALTDGTPGSLTLGAVVARFQYDSYGAVSLLTPGWASTTTDTYHFAYYFQGGRYDSVTGLLHFQARDLSPTLGTWVEKDPTEGAYLDGMDLYQSEDSNPSSTTDATGLQTDWHHMLPQAVLKDLIGQGAIDAAEFGRYMDSKDHSALHSAGWNDEWKLWAAEMKKGGEKITVKACRVQLKVMSKQSKYAAILEKGLPAVMSYGEWKNAPKALKQELEVAIQGLSKLAPEESERLQILMEAAGKAGKAAPIVGAFVQGLLVGHATTSDTHFQAFVNRSIQTIACPDGNYSDIRDEQYRQARGTVALEWAGNLDSSGYTSGEDFVDAMAELFEAMYKVTHPGT